MAKIIALSKRSDPRGDLTVIERECPFPIKRIFYIANVPNQDIARGGHRHYKNRQLLMSVAGSCIVDCDNGRQSESYKLDSAQKALLVEPEDFHQMHSFTKDAVLLVLASETYDANDYIHEGYKK